MNKLKKDPLNLIVSGVGGQGNLVVSRIVGSALVRNGYTVTVGETYGATQRGGAVMSHIRVSEEMEYGPLIPEGTADIILGMEPSEAVRMYGKFGNPNVVTIVNPRPIYPIDVTSGGEEYTDLDKLMEAIDELSAETKVVNATDEAQKMGDPILANMILIGALVGSGWLPLEKEAVIAEIEESFPKVVDINVQALNKGIELAQNQ